MEQLISMRQRIKSVQTIGKITQAMRLISISTHSRLSQKKLNLENYSEALSNLYSKIAPNIKPNFDLTPNENAKANLIIIVASQKGLSGNFNSSLFKFFEKDHAIDIHDQFITIGKNSSDYINKIQNQAPLRKYDKFGSTNFGEIAFAITQFIYENAKKYRSVILYSNYPKSFFVQEPTRFLLLPFEKIEKAKESKSVTEYDIPEKNTLASTLEKLILSTKIQNNLFNSLLAEQAARFLSMDAATRNADSLITEMKTDYNKLRQANITKEITEVTSGLE